MKIGDILEDFQKLGTDMEVSDLLYNMNRGSETAAQQDLSNNGWIKSGPILLFGSSEKSAFSTSVMEKSIVDTEEIEV